MYILSKNHHLFNGFLRCLLPSNERNGLLAVCCGQALVLVCFVAPLYCRQTNVMDSVPDLFLVFWVKFLLWGLVLRANFFTPVLKVLKNKFYCSGVARLFGVADKRIESITNV